MNVLVSQRRWAVPTAIVVAMAVVMVAIAMQRSDSDGIDADAWSVLGEAGSGSGELLFDSLADIAPGGGFDTEAGHVTPADVIVRGRVVDVAPGRAFASSPDPNATESPEVPYDLAPPGSAKYVRLVVYVEEVVAGAMDDGVDDRVGVEVLQPEGTSIDDLREKFQAEGSGVYFLKELRAALSQMGVVSVVPIPPGTYRIMGEALFLDDSASGIETPYLGPNEAEMLLGPVQRFEELLTLVRQFS